MRFSLKLKHSIFAVFTLSEVSFAARQPYDVRKIIEAFRTPHEDLTLLCAHRGLRWNGTAENSRDSYFRAAEAGIECIETDIHISADGYLPMIHDHGLGRTTDVGEQSGQPAYNPFTGMGYNPKIANRKFKGDIEKLRLRDEGGRVRAETVPSLTDMINTIKELGLNVVLQLDFKDYAAIEPAYWALKNLTNAADVPANEWCIYKLRAKWYKNTTEFESLPWVRDAFANNVRLAYIPVYLPQDSGRWDLMDGLKGFMMTNYTISAEFERYSDDWLLQDVFDHVEGSTTPGAVFNTTGIFFAGGDFVDPISSPETFFDTDNYTLPGDASVNNSAFSYKEGRRPVLMDWITSNWSVDGHDYRQNFSWILEQGYDWIIADTPDLWSRRLGSQGRRNITRLIADGEKPIAKTIAKTYYKRFKWGA